MKAMSFLGVSNTNFWYEGQIQNSEEQLELLKKRKSAISLLSLILGKFFFFNVEKDPCEIIISEYSGERFLSLFEIAGYDQSYRLRKGFRKDYYYHADNNLAGWLRYLEEITKNYEQKLIQRIRVLKGLVKDTIRLAFKYKSQIVLNITVLKIFSERTSDKSGNEDNHLVAYSPKPNGLLKHLNSLRHAFIRTEKFNSKYR